MQYQNNVTTQLSDSWKKMSLDEKRLWHYHNFNGFLHMRDTSKMAYHISLLLMAQKNYLRAHENLEFGCNILQNPDCCNLLNTLGTSKQTHEELKNKIDKFLHEHISSIPSEMLDLTLAAAFNIPEMDSKNIDDPPSFSLFEAHNNALTQANHNLFGDSSGELIDAESQYIEGSKYLKGDGVNQDPVMAVYWHLKAALQGHSKAQSSLAYSYQHGLGNEKNSKEAIFWFTKAAEQDNAEAQYNLALIYYKGIEISRSCQKAFNWFKKSAKLGFVEAQYNLACLYNNGDCVDKNFEISFYWFKEAATQNHVEAQYIIGRKCFFGEGTIKSLYNCAYWINLARNNGHSDAEMIWNKEEMWRY
jgi:TPR repeat protein